MESQNCEFCEKSIAECNSVKLYQKGSDTIKQTSEKRSIEVKEGDKAHKECRGTYTKEYSRLIRKKGNLI